MSKAVEELLGILDLEPLEVNLFRGRSPQSGWQRVFGGQVIGQALVAAVRTVDGRRPSTVRTAATSACPITCPPNTRCQPDCGLRPRNRFTSSGSRSRMLKSSSTAFDIA